MLIDIIAGDRPDILRLAPILEAIQNEQRKGTRFGYRFIYTGKDTDIGLYNELFSELEIDKPNLILDIQEPTETASMAAIMLRYERILNNHKPDMILVTGRSTGAMACALAARKTANIKIASLNAGVRTGDATNPHEINRIVTDSISQYFFTASHSANQHLRNAGFTDEQLFLIGSTHIDSLLKLKPQFLQPTFWHNLQLQERKYYVLALHKPYNTAYPATLKNIVLRILKHTKGLPVIMPVLPSIKKVMEVAGVQAHNLHIMHRIGYPQFAYLLTHAKGVITDSVQVQEEATVLHCPTITLYPYTETPETCDIGYNLLADTQSNALETAMDKLQNNHWHSGNAPYLWDGQAAERLVATLKNMI